MKTRVTTHFGRNEDSLMEELRSSGLVNFSDSIKWDLYSLFGKDSCSWGLAHKALPNTPLAFIPLRLISVDINKATDTSFLLYWFLYNDSMWVESRGYDRKPISGEVMFKLSDRKIIGYGTDVFYSLDILSSYPSVRELSSYYSANRIYLDSWLKNEAIKRGLIE